MIKIYIASKMTHAERWRNLYSEFSGVHLVSRWPFLEPFVPPSASDALKFWQDDLADIARCDALIVYAKEGEKLRGALVEAGAAIALDKTVILVGNSEDYGTWQFHPNVYKVQTLGECFERLHMLVANG